MEDAKPQVQIFYPVGTQIVHGISDYCQRLVDALRLQHIDAQFHTFQRTCKGLFFPKKLRWKCEADRRILHLQWPYRLENKKLDYYCSCIEALLLVIRAKFQGARVVITFHERSWRRKPVDFMLLICLADRLVFTTAQIMDAVKKSFPLLGSRIKRISTIIPIGANIPVLHQPANDSWDILYFGIIRRNKGLEDILLLARHLQQAGLNPDGQPWRVRIIGGIDTEPGVWQWLLGEVYELSDEEMNEVLHLHGKYEALNRYLATKKTKLPVTCDFNLPAQQLSEAIGRHRIAYYPYPQALGGINEQRGAPMAVMEHGVVVISSEGKTTPEAMRAGVVLFVQTPAEALRAIERLAKDHDLWARYSSASQKYMVSRWDMIASAHGALYAQYNGCSLPEN